MAGIIIFSFLSSIHNRCIRIHIVQSKKQLRVQVSIPFVAKDIANVRLSVIGGGHLEFPQETVDEKMETVYDTLQLKNTI